MSRPVPEGLPGFLLGRPAGALLPPAGLLPPPDFPLPLAIIRLLAVKLGQSFVTARHRYHQDALPHIVFGIAHDFVIPQGGFHPGAGLPRPVLFGPRLRGAGRQTVPEWSAPDRAGVRGAGRVVCSPDDPRIARCRWP